jgi:hypothetical protein
MADWKEQLQQIQTQRLQVGQMSDNLYGVFSFNYGPTMPPKETTSGETAFPDMGVMNELQDKMAALQADVQKINQELESRKPSMKNSIPG